MTTLRHRVAADTRYTLLGLPTATIHFTVAVAGLSAGLGSAVALVGLPILAGAALAARSLADAERAALPGVLGHPVGRPRYAPPPPGAGPVRRLLNPLASGQAWLDLLHGIVAFPFALASFVLAAVWWAGAVAGLAFPLYGWVVARIPGVEPPLADWLGVPSWLATSDLFFVLVNTGVGVLFALTLPVVLRTAALLRAGVSQALLTRAPEPEPAAFPHGRTLSAATR
ncbi:sensor domain-containing protein [Actinomadura sp. ATCC 31491]|uniref:Sensor domain-containing protein n=1 Tax=Actinomadura luzonensis TaxID=2805427 RepID=A0ABT0FWF0_9ACTN|nr:sensor domain-containing protein [Actinomadura luzonensis]MCK2216671.1 sensor domain-containing protein [Actinomadura luzonensis]